MSDLSKLTIYRVQYWDEKTNEVYELTHKADVVEVDAEEVMSVFTSDGIETTDELIKLGMMRKEQE
tara:strand:- start:1410 stop:1607 length:198 start_codon:yes stop_codon:yes gene_type:complete